MSCSRFDQDLNQGEVTRATKRWLLEGSRKLEHYYAEGENNDAALSKRYADAHLRVRVGSVVGAAPALPAPKQFRRYLLNFSKRSGAALGNDDYRTLVRLFIDNFGYQLRDFRAYYSGELADGYGPFQSDAHLTKVLRDYEDNEVIWLDLEANPVFYYPLLVAMIPRLEAYRDDVAIELTIGKLKLDRSGLHLRFACCDLGDPAGLRDRLLEVLPIACLAELLTTCGEYVPALQARDTFTPEA